jgi:predicted ABC-class ATPase
MKGDAAKLKTLLLALDGRGYKAYKELTGSWAFDGFTLHVDHVQGDPFAASSRLCVEARRDVLGIGDGLVDGSLRRTALGDYLARAFREAAKRIARGNRGIGKSGEISLTAGSQEIIERNAVVFTEDTLQCRFILGLPAEGRTILGREAAEMLLEEVPRIVDEGLRLDSLPAGEALRHIECVEDQEALRAALDGRGLAAFVADGSILPRRSGIDMRPLVKGAVPFAAPRELAVELECPHRGRVRGMGIPRGVTLIVGGGFHGKSTLLDALQSGVYNHLPGDGREGVVTDRTACKVRAEDGRAVTAVDINPFISDLPAGGDTRVFTTVNASGSTSQAANIVEPLEAGCRLVLMDEDTSATNFMIRDERMQELVHKSREPITPFVDRVRGLYAELGVSTILVMGGSGDYFDTADTVIMMDAYRARCVTGEARAVAARLGSRRKSEAAGPLSAPPPRRPDPRSFDPSRGRRPVKIEAPDGRTIIFGRTTVDVAGVEQFSDRSQVLTAAWAVHALASRHLGGGRSLAEALSSLEEEIDAKGLDVLQPWRTGIMARPPPFETAAVINRMRTLRILREES